MGNVISHFKWKLSKDLNSVGGSGNGKEKTNKRHMRGTGKVDLWANGDLCGGKIPHWGIKWMMVQWRSQRVRTCWQGKWWIWFAHTELEQAVTSQKGGIKQAIPNGAPHLMRKLGAGKTQASGVDEIAEGQHRERRNEHTIDWYLNANAKHVLANRFVKF